ncbi:MAG: hypothetical protein R3325_03000 [Thermoanaerobaculia bacterium]|nr:hypothetical protein [Thermoanaerobaculia bacterium]
MNPMEKHVTVVAALRIGFGVLGLAAAVFVFCLLTAIGVVADDEDATVVLSLVATGVAGLLTLISLPGLIGGIGLLSRKGWARILVLIVSVIDLLNVPIGTAVGAYSIWVLVEENTVRLFRGQPPREPAAPAPPAAPTEPPTYD